MSVVLPEMAHRGGTAALTTTPVAGRSEVDPSVAFVPGTETVGPDEIRVTVLGSGDPFPRRAQAVKPADPSRNGSAPRCRAGA